MGLHGAPGNMTEFCNYGWLEKSNTDGFVVVLPSATGGVWRCSGTDMFPHRGAPFGPSPRGKGSSNPDDIGFLRKVLGFVQAGVQSDPHRIYVAGFSAGATMAHRVGVELSDMVAAIACLEAVGTADVDMSYCPKLKAPVSVIAFHEDAGVGLTGHIDPEKRPAYSLASYDMFFDYWSGPNANTCQVKTPKGFTDAPYDGKPTSILLRRASSGLGGAEVVCYALVGGGHQMHANTPMNDPKKVPYHPSCTEPEPGITENEMIGKFFDAHPKGAGGANPAKGK
jgi:poly(3-hydroxybutyrate) depolymerase